MKTTKEYYRLDGDRTITMCTYKDWINVGSVLCKMCEYYKGGMPKRYFVDCSYVKSQKKNKRLK